MELAIRSAIEGKFLSTANKLSDRHRRELLALAGDPPDIRKVTPEFWERVEREERELLAAFLLVVFMENSRSHGMADDTSERLATAYVTQQAPMVAAEYVRHSQGRLLLWRRNWIEVGRKASRGTPSDVAIDRNSAAYRKSFRDEAASIFGTDRNATIVSTEVTRASVSGGEAAMRFRGAISDEDTWETRPWLTQSGPCERCEPLDGLPRRIWGRVFPNGPPVHPRCACAIQYAQ